MSRAASDVGGGCLGDVVAALVDGELDDAARERALRHLTHCAGCRAEVDGQRRLRARLCDAAEPGLPTGLTERLLGLSRSVDEPAAPPAAVPLVPGRTVGSRRGASRRGRARPHRAARRRATTGSAVAALGVAAALALGAPQPRPATTPVDPATDAFVAEFVSTSAGGSSSVVATAGRTTGSTAGLPTFVPLTRAAVLTTGGARPSR